MQKAVSMFTAIMAIMTAGMVVMFFGCAGKTGPTGPAGADGVAKCGTCHNVSTEVLAKQVQWENSTHATGGNYARSDAGCAPCHTNEGFRETLGTVQPKSTKDKILNPTPQNCRTCHNIHKNYDRTDFDLATTAPVQLAFGGTINIGKGNLCAECHQPRPMTPKPALGGPDITLTSTRYGGHHGPQASILLGQGLYEIPGPEKYESSPHGTVVPNGCVTCHMSTPYGNQSGGHTLKMAYDYHGVETQNISACVKCHTTTKNFDVNGTQTDVVALLAELKTQLVNAKLMTDDLVFVKGTYSADKAGIMMNYQLITEDRSEGVHNAKYIKALLKNSIAFLKTAS